MSVDPGRRSRVPSVVCAWMCVALVGALLAAAPAEARVHEQVRGKAAAAGAHGDRLSVRTKTVKKFIRRRAAVVGRNQQPMFPNARIYKTAAWASCSALREGRKWVCAWNAYVYEESTVDPGEFEVRQSTFRFCTTPETTGRHSGVVIVKRARRSRALRIASPWLVGCDLTESSIQSWNVFAYRPDQLWQPVRSEPVPFATTSLPAPDPQPQELLPPPSGAPPGPPPGPLSLGGETPRVAVTSGARSTTGGTGYLWREGSLLGCTQWVPYAYDPSYWVYYCAWRPPSAATLPGAALGIFTQDVVTYWEGYYWVGNDNYGRPLGKLFASGQY